MLPAMTTRFIIWAMLCILGLRAQAASSDRPNILWITSEDHGPEMGCYGDTYATTPNVDRLASRGLLYTRAWSVAPVCAPARTALISALYPQSSGGEHMRSLVAFPAGKKMFPAYLREAGYYCSNNAKEDYNLSKAGDPWNESSRQAHWRKRTAGQPFFAVFNSEKSHESRIRSRPHTPVHDPAKAPVPAYHPDTPETRRDWAQYYDKVTEADADAGSILAQLEADGLAENTIVFYFGDHGSGMPRSKRWCYNSGLQIPLVVHIPEKFRHLRPMEYQAGGKSDRLVSFVDFGPTVLSLAGVPPPGWMQGKAFMGVFNAEPHEFLHGSRGRMDERVDLVRSVTDGRYVYIRNYMPHLIYGQHLDYMWQTPTTAIWEKHFKEGKLNGAQSAFWKRKPPEELYDLQNDPDEVKNLAGSSAHSEIKAKLRKAQQEHIVRIRDIGFIPEGDRFARAAGGSPYDYARREGNYPLAQVLETAERASMLEPWAVPQLIEALGDEDGAVRYWGVLGLVMRGAAATARAREPLRAALKDSSPEVRVAAAQALAQFGGQERELVPMLLEHADWQKNGVFTSIAALNSLYALDAQALPPLETVGGLPTNGPSADARYRSYIPRLIDDLQEKIKTARN